MATETVQAAAGEDDPSLAWIQPSRQCVGLDPAAIGWTPPAPPTPDPVIVTVTAGLTDGHATVGVQVTITATQGGSAASGAPVDWGDGTTNNLRSHTYAAAATAVVITVTASDGGSGSAAPFDVVAAE